MNRGLEQQSRLGIMSRSAALRARPGEELRGLSPSGRLRSPGQPGQINTLLAVELSGVSLLLASCGPAVIRYLENQGIPSENISQVYEFPNVDGVEANNPQDVTSQINFLMYSDNADNPHMVFLTEDGQDISHDREAFLYYIGTPDKISSISIVTANNDENPGLNWQDDPNQFSVAFQMDLAQPLSRTEFDSRINDPNILIDSFASRVLLTNPGTDESIEITFPLPDTVKPRNRAKVSNQLRVLLVGNKQDKIEPTLTPQTIASIPSTPILTEAAPTPSVPMIEVDGLKIPDPKVSNPELFDFNNPDSPIVQFANAFGIKPEEVGNLTPQLLTSVDGKQFVVLTTGDLSATTTFDESGTPLLIAEQGENGEWVWRIADNRLLANNKNLMAGTVIRGLLLSDQKYVDIITNQFNTALIDYQLQWSTLEPQKGQLNFLDADRLINFAEQNNMTVVGQSLIYGQTAPEWLKEGNFTREEYIKMMHDHIITVMSRYKGKVDVWVVVNEAHWLKDYDFWKNKIGDDYIETAFQTAREVDPSAKLIYSDFQNEIPDSPKTNFNKQIVERLKSKGLIDGIGLHMRIDASKPPKKEDLIKTMQDYGIPVYITELDVDLTNVTGTNEERFNLQAKIYQMIMEAGLESGVCKSFIVFGIGDKYSWLEEVKNKPNADATLYDNQLDPKPAFFAIKKPLIFK